MIHSRLRLVGFLCLMALITGVFTVVSAGEDRNAGERRPAANDLIVVNGEVVSIDQFRARMITIERNRTELRAQVDAAQSVNPQVESMLEVMESFSPESITLGSLIMDVAVYQEAVRHGYRAEPDEVHREVQSQRIIFEAIEEDPEAVGQSTELIERHRAYIDSIGEDRWWDEFWPQVIEQQLTTQHFREDLGVDRQRWTELQREIFREAEVELLNEAAVEPATLESAREYMESIWAVVLQ
jgi:hypothetical protein